MHKKLTLSIDESVYNGLHNVIESRKISQFIENLVRPYVLKQDLAKQYKMMAKDEERELEALEWSEALIGDVDYEPR